MKHNEKVHPRKCLSWALLLLAFVTVILGALYHIKKSRIRNEKSFKNNQKCNFLPLFKAYNIKFVSQ